MSIEIKFRGVNPYNKMVMGVSVIDWMHDEVYFDRGSDVSYPINESSLMQYTGLKDKNGVELCDGDIYSQWGEVCKCDFEQTIYEKMNCLIFEGDFEIIGNIYENPELLKANK